VAATRHRMRSAIASASPGPGKRITNCRPPKRPIRSPPRSSARRVCGRECGTAPAAPTGLVFLVLEGALADWKPKQRK
jgi:hypothetical protein